MSKKKWDIPWAKLTREVQDRYLRILWKDGYTERAIADFFKGATKGRIVRRRQTGLNLSSEGRGKVKSVIEYDRFVDLLDIDKMDDMVETGGNVVCIAPVEVPPPEPPEPAKPEPPPVPPRPTPTRRARRRAAEEAEREEMVKEPASGQSDEGDEPLPAAEPIPRGPVYQPERRVVDSDQRSSSNRVRPKVAASEALQCTHRDEDRFRCAYEWTDAVSKKCDMHK